MHSIKSVLYGGRLFQIVKQFPSNLTNELILQRIEIMLILDYNEDIQTQRLYCMINTKVIIST